MELVDEAGLSCDQMLALTTEVVWVVLGAGYRWLDTGHLGQAIAPGRR